MTIQQFELFHGAVLTKIIRSDRPTSLRMFGKTDENLAVYTVSYNSSDVEIFIKRSVNVLPIKKKKKVIGKYWNFPFTSDQISALQQLAKNQNVAIILVCGAKLIKDKMEICLIKPEHFSKVMPTIENEKTLKVERMGKNKMLRIFSSEEVIHKEDLNEMDRWPI